MAPEVLKEDYDSKVDVYSFGVATYQLLTLKLPEVMLKDLTNMKLHHDFIKNLLKGYDNFFVEVVSMCIYQNREKRATMKKLQIYMKNMSPSLKPGPVISKESLVDLEEEDQETILQSMKSDTSLQKEFIEAIGKIPIEETKKLDQQEESSLNSPKKKKGFSLFNIFKKK